MTNELKPKTFIIQVLLVSLWVNVSEVFRYFVIVMPKTREYLAVIPGVLPLNWWVFSVWGVWDFILTALVVFMYWLVSQRFGHNLRSVMLAGTVSWAFFFLLFWIGFFNMGLAPLSLALIALPLAWVEMIVASWLTLKLQTASSNA
jgi:hypothetical protein